jgi:hypothetical protein
MRPVRRPPLRIGPVIRQLIRRAVLAALLGGATAQAQAPAPTPVPVAPGTVVRRPIEAIPEAFPLQPAELPVVNPLYKPADQPAKLLERPSLEDLETRVWLFVTVKIGVDGRVIEGSAVEPPLTGLTLPLPALFRRWRFTPARKGGAPVVTWATYGVELNVDLEKGAFTAFNLVPVGKEDPLPHVVREPPGEEWMLAYPKDVTPAEPGVVSIEECDVLPAPDSVKWKFESARGRTRLTALVRIDETGKVSRIIPTGETDEPLLLVWLRKSAATWKLTPAMAGGKAVPSWMALDTTLEYLIDSAKRKSERVVKKNLRGPKPE